MEELEKLPAFFTWKMLRETIAIEPSEDNIKRLINIIQKPVYSHMFVNTMPNLTSQEHKEIDEKYKAFTTWVLGRFFYLLNQSNLNRVHPLIVDIQKRIMHSIKVTQNYIYQELILEYLKVLQQLNDYAASKYIKSKQLKAFEPDIRVDVQQVLDLQTLFVEVNTKEQCVRMQSALLKFIDYILIDMFEFHCINETTHQILLCLMWILHHSNLRLKMDVFKISAKLLKYSNIDNQMIENFKEQVFDCFLQVLNHIHLNNDSFSSILEEFDEIACKFLSHYKKNYKIYEFLLSKNCKKFVSKELKAICIENLKTQIITNANYAIQERKKCILYKEQILEELKAHKKTTWASIFELELSQLRNSNNFGVDCDLNETFAAVGCVLEIALTAKFELDYIIVDEGEFLTAFLAFVCKHVNLCNCDVDFENFAIILTHSIAFASPNYTKAVMDLLFSCFREKSQQIKEFCYFENEFLTIQGHFNGRSVDKGRIFASCVYLGAVLSACGQSFFWEHELTFLRLFTKVLDEGNSKCSMILAKNLDIFLSSTKQFEEWCVRLVMPLLASENSQLLLEFLKHVPQLYLILYSSYRITACFQNGVLVFELSDALEKTTESYFLGCCEVSSERADGKEAETIARTIDSLILRAEIDVRTEAVKLLPSITKHLRTRSILNYLELMWSEEKNIRDAFVAVVYRTVKNSLEQSQMNIDDCLSNIFKDLLRDTDKSLRLESNFHLQETIVSTIDELSHFDSDFAKASALKLNLYFIIMFTSKEADVAATNFTNLATRLQTSPAKLYLQHRPDFCKVIVKVCVINFVSGKWNLSQSLEIFAAFVWNSRAKSYIVDETRYLLPFFVKAYCNNQQVSVLIDEVAAYNEMEAKDLLAENYGYIYVNSFLNEEPNDFKSYMTIIEKRTGLAESVLKKNNFMIIVNVLLEHFHEDKNKVIRGFMQLANDDSCDSVPDFLQPRLLGILQYFEYKLLKPHCDKQKLLLSLADIFKFLGKKYITPVRFKIIAMLRTALTITESSLSELNCKIWNVFLQSCDLEALGPQLATIFVSIQPLMLTNHAEITDILTYLIVEHEKLFEENLIDLFFVLDFDIDNTITNIIRKQLKTVQDLSFKKHLKFFFRYFTYETLEVQIYALNYIKKLLKANRQNLSQMILGYNGIDPCICELLEFLTGGCREYDQKLKMACGECIAELGAIEPSHLPLSKTLQQENTFNFFIDDTQFILNSLHEFTRALQLKKNSQSMDKFSLAIQETLRAYSISNDISSEHFDIWTSLSDSQKELMLPFLTSKYFIAQNIEAISACPVYGSYYGSSFQSWLNNWTVKLILNLETSKKQLLTAYIPSMKQDLKILMFFLPYILLNSLIGENANAQNEAYEEFMAVIRSQRSERDHDHNEDTRPLKMGNFASSFESIPLDSSCKIEFNKVIFVIFDFLERWVREWVWNNGFSGQSNEYYVNVKKFLGRFNKFQLAKSNFDCGGYPRALMYLEHHMMEIDERIDQQNENLALLSEIYYRLGEPDGVAGVTSLRKCEGTLEQRILHHEVSGQVALATACYERLPINMLQLQGLVRSQLDLDNAHTALYIAKGVWEDQAEWTCDWMREVQAEAMWRLGRFDDLEEYLKKQEVDSSSNWGVRTGFCLLNLKKNNRIEFKSELQQLMLSQINYLGDSTLEKGTYQHGYFYISRLHALNELEQLESVLHELTLSNDEKLALNLINTMKGEWDERLDIVQQSCRTCEPILCLRRAGLQIAKDCLKNSRMKNATDLFDTVLGNTWLKSAQIAMHAEFREKAYSYLLKAEEYAPPTLFLEKAKWFWLCEKHEEALTTLKRGLSFLLPENKVPVEGFSLEKRKICAEAKLLIASYNAAISNVSTDANIMHYKEAIEMLKECEKSLVYLAQYYDRVFQTFPDDDKDAKGSDMQIHMINYFGKSLQYGSTYVYQSMPRMLSIWLDYGTRLLDVTSPTIRDERQQNLLRMTKLIDSFLERLAPFIFLTAFSQLVSRICHPQKEVYKELNLIIAKLILNYPQQTLWMMISVIKSSYPLRSKRGNEILSDPRLKTPAMIKLISDFTQLAEKLIELTNKPTSRTQMKLSVNLMLRSLPRLISKEDFSPIMIPSHKFRKLILPNATDSHTSSYNPFPNHYVYIVSIKDEVTVLNSLQRPRQITLVGSDGKEYIQMLKPKDDLRKDFRLMEFNDIVNQLLSREAESRERRLNIRLYSVAPLNEECGLIEWIPNLVGLRPVLATIYEQKGLTMKPVELREKSASLTDPLDKKRNIYLNILLPRHPPVLGEWFRRTFPDAHGWLTARTAYIRTMAVMSMVGHILGLGDRHGENILLDSTCGDVVHVDFNCLFNKGETFEWPERVPFRLTPNLVAAMGPLGVEGLFRKSCASTLRVLRTHTDTLMSIVTPFVYDPLVSWPKQATVAASTNSELTNLQALEHIRDIQKRLQGKVNIRKSRYYSIPLSVEGQTENLIAEAMSVDNLCQMFIGWGAYL